MLITMVENGSKRFMNVFVFSVRFWSRIMVFMLVICHSNKHAEVSGYAPSSQSRSKL